MGENLEKEELEILRDLTDLYTDAFFCIVEEEKYEKVKEKILAYDPKIHSINIRNMISRTFEAVQRYSGHVNTDDLLIAFRLLELNDEFPDDDTADMLDRWFEEMYDCKNEKAMDELIKWREAEDEIFEAQKKSENSDDNKKGE